MGKVNDKTGRSSKLRLLLLFLMPGIIILTVVFEIQTNIEKNRANTDASVIINFMKEECVRYEKIYAQDDMEETQYDKYISDQKKLLDELKQDYKKALDDRMDNVDVLISDAIASINSNSSNISPFVDDVLWRRTIAPGCTLVNSLLNASSLVGCASVFQSTYARLQKNVLYPNFCAIFKLSKLNFP